MTDSEPITINDDDTDLVGTPEKLEVPKDFILNNKGGVDPIAKVKPQKLEEDAMVRKIIGYGKDLSATIGRFKMHTRDDMDSFMSRLFEHYNFTPSGMKEKGKGNVSFQTYDGLMKVEIAVQDRITFGAELQVAKEKFDEFIRKESKYSSHTIKALLNRAFQVDKKGKINTANLISLKNYNIADSLWQEAVIALTDSIMVESSKSYVRLYERETVDGEWKAISLDIAKL